MGRRREVAAGAAHDVTVAAVVAVRLGAGYALLIGYGVGILAAKRAERIRHAIEHRRP